MPRKKNTDESENGEVSETTETALAEAVAEPSGNGVETAASAEEAPAKSKRGRKAQAEAELQATGEKPKAAKSKLDPARRSAIEKALGDLTKKYGDGTIMRLGEATHLQIETIPTGSLALDIALGVGGVPRGRVSEIYGPESSGKTTICLHIVAEAQKRGGVCGYIDMEHALDPVYAAKLGVDVDNLYISQPDTGEQALEIAEALVRSGAMDVVVIDSVAALVPRSEIEGDMGDATMGMQARLMSQALRKLSGAIKQTNTAVIFTNQLRMKIGVMFGNPETTTGGNALKFYASVRLDVRRIQAIKDGENVIGNRTRVRVTKNKVAAPFREAEFDILYAQGISKEGDLLDIGANLEIITKRGAFFSYNDTRIGQGREQAKNFLRQNPAMANEIDLAIRAQHAATGTPLNVEPDNGDDVVAGDEE
ncbi:MAG: recombinase RecA [Anaerolineales bacterium]